MSLPETVEAIVIDKHGGVEVLEKRTVPFPTQKPGEIVVKVAWGGVNTVDTYYRKGLYPIKLFPQALGVEASGVIVKLPTDDGALNDKWYQERAYKLGANVAISSFIGAHAEYISVPWKSVYPIPEDIKLDTAAASLAHGLTTLTLMTEAYNVQKGDIILIHTVAGGLGLAFTAYAKSRGATVIGTTSSPEKAELAKAYGADHVILYTKENTVQRVLELTNGAGVHAVFDGVGKDTFLADFDLLRRKGTLVAVGNASGPPDPVSPLKLSPKNLKLVRPSMGNYMVTQEETEHYLKELWEALRTGLFKIRIERIYPFTTEGIRQAQTELTTPGGKLAGKILLKVANNV